jgi:hypothetical protein
MPPSAADYTEKTELAIQFYLHFFLAARMATTSGRPSNSRMGFGRCEIRALSSSMPLSVSFGTDSAMTPRRQSGDASLTMDSRPVSGQPDERGCFYDQLPRVFTRSRRLLNEEYELKSSRI